MGMMFLPRSSWASANRIDAASALPSPVTAYASAWPVATRWTAASASVEVAPSLSLMPSWASER